MRGCDREFSGQEMLEKLERRNLFVVPLDDDRRWYRYHHLFADLLRAKLHQSGHDRAAELLLRAAQWCDGKGQIVDAMSYAFAAHNYGYVAELIVKHWQGLTSAGEIELVWSWLDGLPAETIKNNARLGVVYCWVLWLKAEVAQSSHISSMRSRRGTNCWPQGVPAGQSRLCLATCGACCPAHVCRPLS